MNEAYETRQWDVFCENNDLRLENDELKAENARLRELVREMLANMGGCALHGNPLRIREFECRMRELGVEVDG